LPAGSLARVDGLGRSSAAVRGGGGDSSVVTVATVFCMDQELRVEPL
jgi:hypothetical protein